MKNCNRKNCKQENPQPLDSFYKQKGMGDGHRAECKSCKNNIKLKWARRNKKHWASYMRKFRKEHPSSIKDKERKKNRVMRCRYGMNIGSYNNLLMSQDYKCLICFKHTSELNKPLVVDHCHKTNKVRGLLCFSCNRSIAILDNKDLLKNAIKYLNIDLVSQ